MDHPEPLPGPPSAIRIRQPTSTNICRFGNMQTSLQKPGVLQEEQGQIQITHFNSVNSTVSYHWRLRTTVIDQIQK